MSWTDIDLPKLAGVAGATVALIIATAILQSWLTGRYVPAFDRYRSLCEGLRGYRDETRRRGSLRDQISSYRQRLRYLSLASELLSWALILAVVTIATATLSMLAPGHQWIPLTGAVALFAAFALVLGATGLEMVENRIDRAAIESEAVDLDEVNGTRAAV